MKNKPGEAIRPDDWNTVDDKGLPFHKKSYEFGKQDIKINVTFPDSLTQTQLTALNTALGKEEVDNDDMQEDGEALLLKKCPESQRNTHAHCGTRAHDSDGEEEDDGKVAADNVCNALPSDFSGYEILTVAALLI